MHRLEASLNVPIRKITCEIEAKDGEGILSFYLDVFFSRWAEKLEDFIPLIIPIRDDIGISSDENSDLSSTIDPESVIRKLVESYARYLALAKDKGEELKRVRRSYRSTLFLPSPISQIERENKLVRELSTIRGAISGINVLLGRKEGDSILNIRLIGKGELAVIRDRVLLGRGVKYFRGNLGESKLLSKLVNSNSDLYEYIASIIQGQP